MDGSMETGFRARPLWLLALAAVALAQASLCARTHGRTRRAPRRAARARRPPSAAPLSRDPRRGYVPPALFDHLLRPGVSGGLSEDARVRRRLPACRTDARTRRQRRRNRDLQTRSRTAGGDGPVRLCSGGPRARHQCRRLLRRRGARLVRLVDGPRADALRRRRCRSAARRPMRPRVRRLALPLPLGRQPDELPAARGHGGCRLVRAAGGLAGSPAGGRLLLHHGRAAARAGLAPRSRRHHLCRARPQHVVALGLGPLLVAAAALRRRHRALPHLGRPARQHQRQPHAPRQRPARLRRWSCSEHSPASA